MNQQESLPSKLRLLRKENHFTQAQVAFAIHISRQAYQKYEYGSSEPSFETLNRLCEFYHISPYGLLGHKKPEINAILSEDTPYNKSISKEEQELLSIFRLLSSQKREKLLLFAKAIQAAKR